MYIGHVRLSVCESLCAAAYPQYCTNPDVTWGNGRWFPLVVHYWADLQSVHGLRDYGNIERTRNVSQCLYSLYAWLVQQSAGSNTIVDDNVDAQPAVV